MCSRSSRASNLTVSRLFLQAAPAKTGASGVDEIVELSDSLSA